MKIKILTILLAVMLIITGCGEKKSYTAAEPTQEEKELKIRQRDMLRSTTKETYNYSEYTDDEKSPAFSVNGIGIRRVLPLSISNGFTDAADKDITVMINQSPFSYSCTDKDILMILSILFKGQLSFFYVIRFLC